MKKWNMLYENCKLPIRIVTFGFILLAIGYLITNKNVNIFYTITNAYILGLAEILGRIGHIIVVNMPLIFMVNLVSKKANSGAPVLMGIIGYITFLVVMMMCTSKTFEVYNYTNLLNVSYTSMGAQNSTIIYPLQTGLIGSFLVAFMTRYSYLKSRRKNPYSILAFCDKDTTGIIYNIVYCGLLGLGMALIWPYVIGFIASCIEWIAKDITDPTRLAVYGVLDRTLSVLGMSSIIRQPFWFTALGGTYSQVAGQAVVGDVNIWGQMPEASFTFEGAGRFITPYYIINMFITPAIFMGLCFTFSDKRERRKKFVFYFSAALLSIVCGNPLPLDLLLLFVAPLLLIINIVISGSLFAITYINNCFLGFNYSGSTITAMPGAFPDYIINARTPQYEQSMLMIVLIGIICAIVYYLITRVYFEFLAFDLVGSNRSKGIAARVVDAVGGVDNIKEIYSSPYDLVIELNDSELIKFERIKTIGAKRITETRTGITFSFVSSSTIIRKKIEKIIKNSRRIKD